MRQRVVDQRGPEHDEGDVGPEPHPLHDGAGDEGGGEDGEHSRKHRGGLQRNGGGGGGMGSAADALEPEPAEATEQRPAVPEGKRVADEHPLHADHTQRDDALHHRVERVLGADQPAVEERQADGHHHDQRGGGEHPGGVAAGNGGAHRFSSPGAPACLASSSAARCTASALTAVRAALSTSPVRIRMTRSSGCTKILPSPTSPVRAAERIAWMVGSTNGSEHAISIRTFSWNSMTTVVPRYCSTISCSPP